MKSNRCGCGNKKEVGVEACIKCLAKELPKVALVTECPIMEKEIVVEADTVERTVAPKPKKKKKGVFSK